jgi:hypothetical protein
VKVTGGGVAELCADAGRQTAKAPRRQMDSTSDESDERTEALQGDMLATFSKSNLLRNFMVNLFI